MSIKESALQFVAADWPAPPGVHACTTTRQGGVSSGAYASLNLATHVGDDAAAVAENRRRVAQALNLPSTPIWLEQVHGCDVVDAAHARNVPCADASTTAQSGVVLAVLTADCVPVILCDRRGEHMAVAHAGWRGLAGGIIEATVRALPVAPSDLLAWLGPAIGPTAFEVGEDVRRVFVAHDPLAIAAFAPGRPGHYFADLFALARMRLARVGVTQCFGGQCCTYTDATQFYSHRRDGTTGRMATLLWRDVV